MASNNNPMLNADRISSLPDDVLCHILSFIPTKYSVRTSLLSTRWKHLFTFVPNLDFDFEYESIKPNSTVSSKFMHFVNSVFMFYNVSRMNKFRARFFINGPKDFPMFSWISAAIRRHVKAIEINCFLCKPTILPLGLFSSKTLTSLTLAGRFNVVLPRSVCLPCLRTCYFSRVKFDDESAKRLFRSCPVLERLVLIDYILGEGVEVLDISSPTLKELSIDGYRDDYKLLLNLPNLLNFSYTGSMKNQFLGLDSLKSLIDAYVSYVSFLHSQDSGVSELVRSFYNVQRLSLNCNVMEAFTLSGHWLPNFDNLTTLTLKFDPISSLAPRLLSDLLHNTPRLEYLNIVNECEIGQNDAGEYEYEYLSPDYVPACVSQHLKEVNITFTGLDYEQELIKYLMKYAYNLKKMIIRSRLNWSEQYEITSEACEVVVDVDDEEIYD